jgi:hypothetical protein
MEMLATQRRGHFRCRPGFTPASQRSGHAGQTPAGTVNVWLIVAATRDRDAGALADALLREARPDRAATLHRGARERSIAFAASGLSNAVTHSPGRLYD